MPCADILLNRVNHLFKRFYHARFFDIVVLERMDGIVKNLGQCGGEHTDFVFRGIRETQFLVIHLLRHFSEVNRMVADAFKIADHV